MSGTVMLPRVEDHPSADLRVAGVQVAIREVEVELREQGPDVRERVRELLAGLGDIASFGCCHAAAGRDVSFLSTARRCEKDEGKQQRRHHNWLAPDSCASNSRVLFCFHLNHLSRPRESPCRCRMRRHSSSRVYIRSRLSRAPPPRTPLFSCSSCNVPKNLRGQLPILGSQQPISADCEQPGQLKGSISSKRRQLAETRTHSNDLLRERSSLISGDRTRRKLAGNRGSPRRIGAARRLQSADAEPPSLHKESESKRKTRGLPALSCGRRCPSHSGKQ